MNLTKQHAESTPMPSSLEYQLPSATVGGMDAASLPHTVAATATDSVLSNICDVFGNFKIFVSLTFFLLATTACAQTASENKLVLASLAPIYQLSLPLVANTDINLQLLPESPRSMQTHNALFVRQADRYAEQFSQADAVITVGKLWAGDPFYISARQFNIRVVNIDASKPYSNELDGVAVANSPVSGGVSPWFWLSPSNVIRIIDIVATDLQQLYPDAADIIKANADAEKATYLTIKSDIEQRLLAVDDPLVYALSDEFVYLTRDLGVFVDDYFVKQDIDWTAGDYLKLSANLKAHDIKVVIHKWEPAVEIRTAIAQGGAHLLVLDTLETTTDFAGGFRQNLDGLVNAFLKQ